MKGKSRILLEVLCLLSAFCFVGHASNIQKVAESDTVFIRSDGSIYPPLTNIVSVDNVTYTLCGNIYGSVVVEKDDIVVDGAGYVLNGPLVGTGVSLTGRKNVSITNMQIRGFLSAVSLIDSSNNNVSLNNIKDNLKGGIQLVSSSNNMISRNRIANQVSGISISGFSVCNTIDGNNLTSNSELGVGIESAYATYNGISGNYISHSARGIQVLSDHNIVSENIMVKNWDGILMASCSFNIVIGNSIVDNSQNGIQLSGDSSNNTIFENNLAANVLCGIKLDITTNNNTITRNSLIKNGLGIHAADCFDNSIYHNSFLSNTRQVFSSDAVAMWDAGYPSGGNYWSDYEGRDIYSGAHQNEIGCDGIGDSPYVVDENNTDNYPLTSPIAPNIEARHLLNSSFAALSEPVTGLQEQLNSLSSTLQDAIDKLQEQYDSLNTRAGNTGTLLYVCAAFIVVLIAATSYLALRELKRNRRARQQQTQLGIKN
jgi:parallel beta-helix repeat protein